MVSLSTLQDFRQVQTLPFCYVCGREFVPGDSTDRDHVPARKVFHVRDREPAMWLPTHKKCNGEHSGVDQRMTQLIGVRWGKALTARDRQLDVKVFGPATAAVMNLNIDYVVMRWVRAFHAALYREPLQGFKHALVTPFPTVKRTPITAINPIQGQHLAYVQTIKEQRALRNLDRISSNNRKLTYECVWTQTDGGEVWLCVFALNLYDWKVLGKTIGQPLRGCAGMYLRESRPPPDTATRKRMTPIIIPNLDQLDPFAA